MTESDASILAALIAATVALVIVIIRDVIIDHRRDQRQRRRDILDRKLSNAYGPLWLALGGEKGHFGNILSDRDAIKRIASNFHLFSPEIQDVITRHILLGNFDGRELQFTLQEQQTLLQITPAFKQKLKSELLQLQQEFLNA